MFLLHSIQEKQSQSHSMNRNRFKDYLLFNRDILIGVACGFFTSAIISQLIGKFTSTLTNSLISQVADMGIFLSCLAFYFIETINIDLSLMVDLRLSCYSRCNGVSYPPIQRTTQRRIRLSASFRRITADICRIIF